MSGGGSGQRPLRLSRVNLGCDDRVDDLDYSEQPGPSNPRPPPHHHRSQGPRPLRSFHNPDSGSSSYAPPHPSPPSRPPHRDSQPRVPTPSPEPDKDVLAYIRAQKQDAIAAIAAEEQQLAERLKREKFQHGAGKVKSRMQKEREAEERKKKQAEQDAARAYNEFVAAMQGDVADVTVSSHRQDGEQRPRKPASAFVAAGGKAYVGSRAKLVPPPPSAPVEASSKNANSKRETSPSTKRVSTAFRQDQDQDSPEETASHQSTPRMEAIKPPRKRQAMTSFLSELQSCQAERESRLSILASTTNTSISTLLAHETLAKPGSRDLVSDPLTTNICIVSLPPNVDERQVAEFFREWGHVATVKIMWPRGEQVGRDRMGRLTGFVAYMTRGEAERGFREADGAVWGGTRLKLSWGKSMPLPQRAMYPMQRRREVMAEEKGGESGGKAVVPKLVVRHRRVKKEAERERVKRRVEEIGGETQRLFIETLASRFKSNGGRNFEGILRERERYNPKFSFLFDDKSPLYHHFRMCLDPHYTPLPTSSPEEEREFNDEGSDELYSTDSGEESESNHLGHSTFPSSSSTPLGPLARRRLICMLRSLTLRRDRIARITSFAIDHSSSYPTVVSILTSSLLRPTTPIPRKLARLYALSDILHNSGTPISNAWRYRAALEAQLPLIFAHMGQVVKSFAGRIRREEFRGKVLDVLQVWEGWIVVSPHVLERLRKVFDQPPVTRKPAGHGKVVEEEDTTSAHPTTEAQEEDLDGEAMVDLPVP